MQVEVVDLTQPDLPEPSLLQSEVVDLTERQVQVQVGEGWMSICIHACMNIRTNVLSYWCTDRPTGACTHSGCALSRARAHTHTHIHTCTNAHMHSKERIKNSLFTQPVLGGEWSRFMICPFPVSGLTCAWWFVIYLEVKRWSREAWFCFIQACMLRARSHAHVHAHKCK